MVNLGSLGGVQGIERAPKRVPLRGAHGLAF
jgi:hypothetical protein